MPLVAQRLDTSLVRTLDAVLVSQVAALNEFEVISAADIEALLRAEGMRDTLGCNDVSCAAEIGGALNARSSIAGTVSRLGNFLLIDLTLFDNAKTQVLRRAHVEVKNDEDFFANAMREAVLRLFSIETAVPEKGTPTAAQILAEPGELDIDSSPKDAYVIIDDRLAGTTPLRISLPSGNHRISVEKRGFVLYAKSQKIESGKTAVVRVSLVDFENAVSARRATILGNWGVVGLGLVALGGAAAILLTPASEQGEYPGEWKHPWLQPVTQGLAILGVGATIGGIYLVLTPPSFPLGTLHLDRIDQLDRWQTSTSEPRGRGASLAVAF